MTNTLIPHRAIRTLIFILATSLAGFASVVKPWKFIGSRKRGLGILGIGVLVAMAGCLLPAAH